MEQSFKLQPPDQINLTHKMEDFNTVKLPERLYRVFSQQGKDINNKTVRYNWDYFDQGKDGRFNGYSSTPPPNPFGTVYAASSIDGALSESIFRRHKAGMKPGVSKATLDEKGLVIIFPKAELNIIDLTDEKNRNLLDIDKQIFTTPDYPVCHKYSHYFKHLGFDGIFYESRNSNNNCYAIFEGNMSNDEGEVLGSLRNSVYDICLRLSNAKGIPFT